MFIKIANIIRDSLLNLANAIKIAASVTYRQERAFQTFGIREFVRVNHKLGNYPEICDSILQCSYGAFFYANISPTLV